MKPKRTQQKPRFSFKIWFPINVEDKNISLVIPRCFNYSREVHVKSSIYNFDTLLNQSMKIKKTKEWIFWMFPSYSLIKINIFKLAKLRNYSIIPIKEVWAAATVRDILVKSPDFNLFYATGLFEHFLKEKEDLWFTDAFRLFRKR